MFKRSFKQPFIGQTMHGSRKSQSCLIEGVNVYRFTVVEQRLINSSVCVNSLFETGIVYIGRLDKLPAATLLNRLY